MWKCQIFLRLGGKNAVARVAVQAAVYSLSYCYGAFYTIVLFRQLVNAIQARASFASVLGLLAVFCAMGVANTLLKGWYEHRFVPRSDCALEQALAASVYQKAASADLACFEDSGYYDRMGRAAATARESALAALDAMSDLLATACILVANALYVVWVDGTLLPLIALPAALALHWQRKKGRAGRAHGRSVRTIPAAHGVCAARFTAEGIRAGNPPHRRGQNRRGALSGRVRWTDARGPGTRLAHCPL